ncbi:hypothetical protein CPX_001282 [Candidatus Phytoplasma pruni]|uniref:Uncharacterized protein n=1 Tax=Candidatus Phytoplasma pruni TaxID=479893 RepID=A0A0M1N0N6_9MOLU|nr:hypothetical protein [Candidatus Phytoplasma pruni]KOR75722.1 hypothetical protein CPX_001282 [Candidatus Phytoplasma pruni]
MFNYKYKLIKERQRLINLQYKIFENIFKIKRILNKLHYEDRRLRIEVGLGLPLNGVRFFQKEEDYLKKLKNSLEVIVFPEMTHEIYNSNDPK